MNLRQIRKQHGVTQEEMAEKLGVSRPTYIRIENGEKEPTLSQAKTLAEMIKPHPEKKSLTTPDKRQPAGKHRPTGFNPQKFKELLLYVLEKVGAKPNIGETALYKLLYFMDFDYYEQHGKPLTGATYIKNHHGPTPLQFKQVAGEMIEHGEMERVNSKYFQYDQKKYLPRRKSNLDLFTASEKEHMDGVIARLADKNGSEMRAYSHEDIPWIAAKDLQKIDYNMVFQRTATFARTDTDKQWSEASASDIIKELGDISDSEYNYYQNLPEGK